MLSHRTINACRKVIYHVGQQRLVELSPQGHVHIKGQRSAKEEIAEAGVRAGGGGLVHHCLLKHGEAHRGRIELLTAVRVRNRRPAKLNGLGQRNCPLLA